MSRRTKASHRKQRLHRVAFPLQVLTVRVNVSGILVHEWLAPSGGSENVFEALGEAFPDAEQWCLWNDAVDRFPSVSETRLSATPLRRSKALALPLMPLVWRTLPVREASWILVSSHLFAHHARFAGPARDAPKFVYAHTPARYIWSPEFDSRGSGRAVRAVAKPFKAIDRRRAKEAVGVAANSQFVAERIRRYWERDAEVIYPPVDVNAVSRGGELSEAERKVVATLPTDFVLGVSRLIPYKRLDLVVQAGHAAGLPVVIAGAGPEEQNLRSYAEEVHPGQVSFVRSPSNFLLYELYKRASVLVFPPVEDFGIVPVEAMAAGTPVVASRAGGTGESVSPGISGALVDSWDSKQDVVEALALALDCSAQACADYAQKFDKSVFADRIRTFVGEPIDE